MSTGELPPSNGAVLPRPVWVMIVRALASIRPREPAQIVLSAFALAIVLTTALLLLPIAKESDAHATTVLQALFTATSAVCVTGLAVVDTPTHWSLFGEVVILGAMQLGGFGIMTSASLLGLLISRQMGLRSRLLAAAEAQVLGLGDVRKVILGVAVTMASIEIVVAAVVSVWLWLHYDMSVQMAVYSGVFHSVSAFTNTGLALHSEGLVRYVTDPVICLSLSLAVILGGIGFPVLFEVRREFRTPLHWSIHTKITLVATGILLVGGIAGITMMEWTNPATLGSLSASDKILAGTFAGVMPRSGGLNTLDYSQMHETTWLATDILMFIGGGSASTAGGIKVTTFFLLFFAIVAEARGDTAVEAFSRRISSAMMRQALSIALLSVAVVVFGTFLILGMSEFDLDRVLFEAISAFSTTGLSTGITPQLPPAAQYVLIVLMFIGRTGPATFASALALRERHKLYRLPEERPIVG